VKATTAGTFWFRLNAVDFMNSSLQFAALAVLVLFPFLITVSAESGGDARHALVARPGLDQQAAQDVDQLMSSGRDAVTTLSIVGAAVVLLGALGIASTLQVRYERAYDQPPAQNLARQLARRFLWLGGLVGYLTLQDFSFIHLKQLPSMLTGKGATPAFWSRSLKSSTAGIPLATIASRQMRRNGVGSSSPTRRSRSCFHAEANSGRSSRADQPALPAAAQPS